MKDRSSNPVNAREGVLRDEISFWRDYIERCDSLSDAPVPARAYEALELAERKLMWHLATQDDAPRLRRRNH